MTYQAMSQEEKEAGEDRVEHDADESYVIELMIRQHVPAGPAWLRAIEWLQGFQRAAGWNLGANEVRTDGER